jgi:hypothetical protein
MAVCKYCYDPRRDEIDRLFVVATPLRVIVATYGGSLGSASRHRKHVAAMIRERTPAQREKIGSDLTARVEKLLDESISLMTTAKAVGHWKTAITAIGAATRLLELVGKLSGELVTAPNGAIHLNFTSNKLLRSADVEQHTDQTELATLAFEALESLASTKGLDAEQIARLERVIDIGAQMSTRTSRNTPDAPLQLEASKVDESATSTNVPEDSISSPLDR